MPDTKVSTLSSGTNAWMEPPKPPPWMRTAPSSPSRCSASARATMAGWSLPAVRDVLQVHARAGSGAAGEVEEGVDIARTQRIPALDHEAVLDVVVQRAQHRAVAQLGAASPRRARRTARREPRTGGSCRTRRPQLASRREQRRSRPCSRCDRCPCRPGRAHSPCRRSRSRASRTGGSPDPRS